MLDLKLVRALIANIDDSDLPTNPDYSSWTIQQQAKADILGDCLIWLKWEAKPSKNRDKLIQKLSKYFDSAGDWHYQG